MPYASEAQRRFLHAKHPKIAKRWDKEYGSVGFKKHPLGDAIAKRMAKNSGNMKNMPSGRSIKMPNQNSGGTRSIPENRGPGPNLKKGAPFQEAVKRRMAKNRLSMQ